jgi:hypothetical protein
MEAVPDGGERFVSIVNRCNTCIEHHISINEAIAQAFNAGVRWDLGLGHATDRHAGDRRVRAGWACRIPDAEKGVFTIGAWAICRIFRSCMQKPRETALNSFKPTWVSVARSSRLQKQSF